MVSIYIYHYAWWFLQIRWCLLSCSSSRPKECYCWLIFYSQEVYSRPDASHCFLDSNHWWNCLVRKILFFHFLIYSTPPSTCLLHPCTIIFFSRMFFTSRIHLFSFLLKMMIFITLRLLIDPSMIYFKLCI